MTTSMADAADDDDDRDNKKDKNLTNDVICSKTYAKLKRARNPASRRWITLIDYLGIFIFLGLLILIAILVWEVIIPTRKQRVYYTVLGVSLIPVLMALYAAVRPGKQLHQRITPVVVVTAVICGRFPKWCMLYVNAFLAAVALFIFGWITRPVEDDQSTTPNDVQQQSDEERKHLVENSSSSSSSITTHHHQHQQQKQKALVAVTPGMSKQMQYNLGKTTLCAALLTIVLLSENFFIWVVSATFEPGWNPLTAPEPLQDNGRRSMQVLFNELELTKRDVVSMRRVWNVQWALVAALGTALCTFDYHPTRQLWSMGCRALLTLSSARFLRTVSFLLTVLPSQNKHCYGQHYPNPPPADWEAWILEGFKPNSSGGCNDLIVSGHATVTTTAACVAVGMADDPLFSVAVSMMLALDFAVEIYEGFHYSVDMWMGAILVGLLWRVWKPFEDNNTDRNASTLHDLAQRLWTDKLKLQDVAYFGGPALVAFLQVTVFPSVWGIPIMVATMAALVSQITFYGFQQYHKHVFFCALYILLGIFL